MTMLGARLKQSKNACGYGCCDRHRGGRDRKTKNERTRDKRAWKKDV